jgi:CRISPR-associated endoribonuclease Cas6
LIFRLQPLRFSFVAIEPLHFGEGKSANILRGAFGVIFRRIACVPQCDGVATCEWRTSCPYARMCEPSALNPGPSGLADWPRPFVFRALHLDGRTFTAGDAFHFDLNLFDTETPAIGYLVKTFAELAREGLGAKRRKVELTGVLQLNERKAPNILLYERGQIRVRQNPAPLEFDLREELEPVSRVRIGFLTPTELKSGQQLASQPEFGILAARVRDRISTLRELYGGGPLDLDFKAFGERASRVKMTSCEIRHMDVERRSSRTGQVHSIGGFVGEAEYEGDLREFLPYLKLAQWTGVGRQTVWGKGEIDVTAG